MLIVNNLKFGLIKKNKHPIFTILFYICLALFFFNKQSNFVKFGVKHLHYMC